MATLRAAREFGMEPMKAAEIATHAGSFEQLVDALADALLERAPLRVPATPG